MTVRTKRILIASLTLLLALSSVAVAKNRQLVRARYALEGNFGLGELYRGASNLTYVVDKTPLKEKAYKFGFLIKARTRFGRAGNNAEYVTVFRAHQGGVARLFTPSKARIEVHLVRRNPSSNRVNRAEVWVYENNQTRKIPLGIVRRATQLTVCWTAKTRKRPGTVIIEMNGVEVYNQSDFDTKRMRIDTVALGNLGSDNLADVSRWLALDLFFSAKI